MDRAKDVPPDYYSEASTGVVDSAVRPARNRCSSASNSAMRCGGSVLPETICRCRCVEDQKVYYMYAKVSGSRWRH
eukprot:6943340-Heterocapsa_arctica.AAC.1